MSEPLPLSETERRWLRRMERTLKDMPNRLLMVECADSLILVDRDMAKNVLLHDGGVRDERVYLSDVRYSFMKCTGVSG